MIVLVSRVVAGVALVVLTVIFGWLVFGRYVLNATPTWVEQVSLLLVMLIAFLGAAVGVRENTHLVGHHLPQHACPTGSGRSSSLISDLLMAGFGGLMLWYGAQLTAFKWVAHDPADPDPRGLPFPAADDCRRSDPRLLSRPSARAS